MRSIAVLALLVTVEPGKLLVDPPFLPRRLVDSLSKQTLPKAPEEYLNRTVEVVGLKHAH